MATKSKGVKVIQPGLTYPTYAKWIETHYPSHFKKWAQGEVADTNDKYELLGMARHSDEGPMCCLIRSKTTKLVYIIDRLGIEIEGLPQITRIVKPPKKGLDAPAFTMEAFAKK